MALHGQDFGRRRVGHQEILHLTAAVRADRCVQGDVAAHATFHLDDLAYGHR